MIRIVGLWAPVVSFMVAVWFLSDGLSLATPGLLSDKIMHFAAYGLFGLCNLRAFHGGFRRPAAWPSFAALLLTGGFGALDEWRQTGVSFRDASGQDWVADLAGGMVALLILWFVPFDRDRRPAPGKDPE